MMPGASNQKRKRGGQLGTPANIETASGRASKRATANKAQLDEQNDVRSSGRLAGSTSNAGKRGRTGTAMAESPNPKKRGRPAKSQDEEVGAGEATRPSKRIKQAESESTSKEPSARRSNRDRRSVDDNPWWAAKPNAASPPAPQPEKAPEKKGSEQVQGSSKGVADKASKKPAEKPAPVEVQPEPEPGARPAKVAKPPKGPPTEGDGVRRSGRDRRSADENPWWSSQANAPSPKNTPPKKAPSGQSKKSSRGRSSLGEVPVSRAQNKAAQGGSKQASKGPVPKPRDDASSQRATQLVKRPPIKSGARSSGADSEMSAAKRRRSSGTSSEPRRRRQSDQGGAPGETSSAPARKYRHLASRTRQIPRATISAKWSSLDDASIAAVDRIILEASRPVLSRLRDRDQRHQQAQTILRTFAKRLHIKLVKGLPFPPPSTTTGRSTAAASSHEMELDFERTVDGIQALEKTLEPLLHSVALLTAERDREEEALEKEYKLLRALETNARAEARKWREHEKSDHVLAPGIRITEQGIGEEEMERTKPAMGGVFRGLKKESLVALSRQIGSHMESIKGNLQQIDGVLPAIVKSRAALQGVLHQYLDLAQYDQAVLG